MTSEKITFVASLYRAKLISMGIPKLRFSPIKILHCKHEALAHCHSMLDKITEFAKTGRTEKALRWLGFVQGCLWSNRIYSIRELKEHNRP